GADRRSGGGVRRELGLHAELRRRPRGVDRQQLDGPSPAALRSLPLHPPEPRPLVPGRHPGARHHDEPEPPGGEGPPPRRARLPGEPEGGAGDPPPEWQGGPPADPSVAATPRDPADPDGADGGAGSAG